MNYLRRFLTGPVPQSERVPGTVPNNAGGYSFPLDDWKRLDRFLILGSEGGSYYASERTLTRENAGVVERCVREDGRRVVARVVEISEGGRAPKNDPALFALALAGKVGDDATRRAAFEALPRVARTGTHLLHWAAYSRALGMSGRGWRTAVGRWFLDREPANLAYQAIKYQSRDGWALRDLLRLARPKAPDETRNAILHWIVKGWPGVGQAPHPDEALVQIWAFERAKRAETVGELVDLIRAYRLPREAVPTHFLNHAEVWEALLDEMGLTAMIRNLATMTRAGLVAAGSDATVRIVEQLRNGERLRRARVHPIALLAALRTYSQGHGQRSAHTWTPVQQIIDALDDAFYLAFGNVEPVGKPVVLALDVSASMGGGQVAGVPGLTPRVASAAMALITAATEPYYRIVGFSHELVDIPISPGQRLDDVIRRVAGIPMGATDCALPMLWALGYQPQGGNLWRQAGQYARVGDAIEGIGAFIVYTDSETWYGAIHPAQALQQYRQETGSAAKLVVVGMVSNGFSVADPNDGGMMDVVGFDTAAPTLIADFARE